MIDINDLDLKQAGYLIGQIVCIGDDTSRNAKRVIFSQRLNCYALQNRGDEIGHQRNEFIDLPFGETPILWGSFDDCFTLPSHCTKIKVIGFQAVIHPAGLEPQETPPNKACSGLAASGAIVSEGYVAASH